MEHGITIGAAAELTGLTAHTLRYNERIGLVTPPGRDPGGERRSCDADLRWVETLTKRRTTGMPMATMLRYAELARSGDATTADRLVLVEEHRAGVVRRIDDLRRDLAFPDVRIATYRATEQADADGSGHPTPQRATPRKGTPA